MPVAVVVPPTADGNRTMPGAWADRVWITWAPGIGSKFPGRRRSTTSATICPLRRNRATRSNSACTTPLSCRATLGYNPSPPKVAEPSAGASSMVKYPILVMAAILLGVIAGCQTPFPTKQPPAGLATNPVPPESSINLLGRSRSRWSSPPVAIPSGIGSRRDSPSRMPGSRRRTERGCTDGTCLTRSPARSCSSATATAATWRVGGCPADSARSHGRDGDGIRLPRLRP